MFESFVMGLSSIFLLLNGGSIYEEGQPILVASTDIKALFESVEMGDQVPRFYARKDWGANEGLRLKSFFKHQSNPGRRLPPEAKKLPSSMKPKIRQKKLEGKDLYWPVEENQVIKKVVVHHTAEAVDERRSPMTLMRAIYYYHTKVKDGGWGDIGYNFVIDKRGNIYEGRAGGPRAVGAHTAYYNTGTLGIALMGNFQKERPTPKQLRSLEILIAHVATQEDLDPQKSTTFLGNKSGTISGHRDVAVEGHGTACPGKHLHDILPQIRRNVATFVQKIESRPRTTARDRVARNSSYSPVARADRDENPEDVTPQIAFDHIIKTTHIRRGEDTVIHVRVKNGTNYSWPRGSRIKVGNVPEGMVMTAFTSLRDTPPGKSGVFRSKLKVDKTPNGYYDIALKEDLASVTSQPQKMTVPIQVSGDKLGFLRSFQATLVRKRSETSLRDLRKPSQRVRHKQTDNKPKGIQKEADQFGPNVKIKLAFFDHKFAHITSKDWVKISHKKKTLIDVAPNTLIKITGRDEGLHIAVGEHNWILSGIDIKTFSQSGILTIKNYDRGLGSTPYNSFRRQINIYKARTDNKLILVNELPLEQYLWGLAEEPTSEPIEKKHAIHVLARSYALVYNGSKRKFGTVLYDLEDDPRTSQFYLGYDWERYHNEQKGILKQTHGEVITKGGLPVIGPYFTQSSGRSLDTWASQYPWAKARDLPYDKGLEQKGHGIGLSGNSARMLAKKGVKYPAILEYFFEGLDLKTVY